MLRGRTCITYFCESDSELCSFAIFTKCGSLTMLLNIFVSWVSFLSKVNSNNIYLSEALQGKHE